MNRFNSKFMLALCSASMMCINAFAQTQYDYYDDSAVYGGADRALNGIVIIVIIVIALAVLIFVSAIALKTYYFINPNADPEYKIAKEKECDSKSNRFRPFSEMGLV